MVGDKSKVKYHEELAHCVEPDGGGEGIGKKKMIILHKGPAEHRDPGTSSPQGEPGTPPSVLTPQSPCTVERAVGVGALYQDTIYAAAVGTNVTTPFCTGRGGSSLPSGWGRILGQGHPRPPRAMLGRQLRLQFQIRGNNQPFPIHPPGCAP